MDRLQKEEYLNYLSGLITPERLGKMNEVLSFRTKFLTVVIEDVYQSHNASAVLRSCDCFGILDVHIIENKNEYQINPDVALGSTKWLNLHNYYEREENSSLCIEELRKRGYRVIATTPHLDDCNLEDLPLDVPTAIIFGNEREGLSPVSMKMADGFMKIPMVGFTESLNISVSAAICLQNLSTRLRNSQKSWQLGDEERIDTLIKWIHHTIKRPDLVEKEFKQRYLKK